MYRSSSLRIVRESSRNHSSTLTRRAIYWVGARKSRWRRASQRVTTGSRADTKERWFDPILLPSGDTQLADGADHQLLGLHQVRAGRPRDSVAGQLGDHLRQMV